MGRGLGLHNMSIEELKEAKRERDQERYTRDRKLIQKQNHLKAKNALTINCPCGGHYKDLTKNKNSHTQTPKHTLWEEEQEINIHEVVMSKYAHCKTIEDAHNKLITLYEDNGKYKALDRLAFLAKLMRALQKKPDATPPPPPTPPPTPPPPKKIKIKIKKLKLKLKTSEP